MLSDRFARSAFDQASSQGAREGLARELNRVLDPQLPPPDPAAWLRELVADLDRLGHTMRVEDTEPDMQVWGDYARIVCDGWAHDLALFIHGQFDAETYGLFEAGPPIRIDGIEVLWQKT